MAVAAGGGNFGGLRLRGELDGPYDRPGLAGRVLPFAVVAIIAEASLAIPPGPTSDSYAVLSAVLLVMVAAAMFFLPWTGLPRWTTVLVPVAYVGSVLALILALGGSSSGVGIVVLLPLVWTALYDRRWISFVVVAAIANVQLVTSLSPVREPDAVLVRRVFFWSAVGVLLAVVTHDLRDRLHRTLAEREASLRRTEGLEKAAEELTVILDSEVVLTTAIKLAAELVSPTGTLGRRAQYSRVVGPTVVMVAQYDEAEHLPIAPFLLSDHPNLMEVMRTGEATNRPIAADHVGPTVRGVVSSLGVTNAVYVPIYVDGTIDGVLSVSVRGQAVSPELFECCKAIGHLTELALGNARTHEMLASQAKSDELTGLANRRAFDRMLVDRPGRLPFCVLAMDVDGLKQVNDNDGHATGDALLIHIANVINSTLRRGDVLARVGGDEFASLIIDAYESDGVNVAGRMLAALEAAPFRGAPVCVSIGVASGTAESDGLAVHVAADHAMYLAKREGGRRHAVATRSGAYGKA